MTAYTAETLEVTPYFDIERLMELSQETRLGGEVLEKLAARWEQWLPLLHVRRLDVGKVQYLLTWLEQDVEEQIDKFWEDAPSDAYLYNALAQLLCMGAVHQILPEIEDAGCAPAPRPTEKLAAALQGEGLSYKAGPTLSLRYAVVTHFPFKGGCEICHLQAECPKGQGGGQAQQGCPSGQAAASVVLPGYEQ